MTEQRDMRGIRQLPSGNFQVRIAHQRHRRPLGVFQTYEEALVQRDAAWAEIADGNLTLADGMTVEQWGPTFLARYRKTLRGYASDRSRFYLHIVASRLGRMPITAVTTRDVRGWLRDLKRKRTQHKHGDRPAVPLSRQLRKHCLNLLRAFFNACIEEDLLAANPCVGVKLGDAAAPIPDDWYLTPEEQRAALDAVAGPERWIVAFAIGTGLRQGEQWNLHLADLVVTGADPHVLVRFGSNGQPPKNGKVRKVPLFGLGLEAARAWLAELESYAPSNPLGLVFPTPGGARRGKSKVPACWPAVRDAVPRLRIWWHLLRHTAASSLVAGWWGRKWTLEEVCKFMGHSSIVVTQRYAHLADTALRDVARETNAKWARGGHAAALAVAERGGIIQYARPDSNGRHSASKAKSFEGFRVLSGADAHDVPAARRLLEAAGYGDQDEARALAEDLAAAVLARREVRLAMQIAAGGPLVLQRGVELAELVCAAAAEAETVIDVVGA